MKYTPEEWNMAVKMHRLTGKSFHTCLFCLKCKRGNFKEALEFCTQDSKEDGR